jgi:Ca2+-binding RTX toxin-like protein
MPSKVVTGIELATVTLDGANHFLYVTGSGDLRASGVTVTVTSGSGRIINAGSIASLTESNVGSPAIAVAAASSVSITNTGLIASTGKAIECSNFGFAFVDNTGTILGDLTLSGSLNNAGTIIGGVEAFAGTDISNSGRIIARSAAVYAVPGNALELVNTGEISGNFAVVTSQTGANDVVTNAGKMVGQVELFAGNDLFDGQLGVTLGQISGGTGADTILAGANHDTILGGEGADLLDGGAGLDLVSYRFGASPVLVDLQSEALNTGDAAEDILLNFEGVIGTSLDDTLSGTTAANDLRGDGGNDVLDGRAGNDSLRGGGGNDLMMVNAALDRVFEAAGQGQDTVMASVSYRVAAGAEVELLATADAAATTSLNLTGSNTDNRVVGNAGTNRLFGRSGADTLEGLGGNDQLYGNDGTDVLFGGIGNDLLFGEAGASTLRGEDGNDRLTGGQEADQFNGGAGADVFVVSPLGFANVDTFTDFTPTDDVFWLPRALFPTLPLGTLAASAFATGAVTAFTTPAQRIFYNSINGNLTFDPDGNGPLTAGALIGRLTNLPAGLSHADFVVVA